ncbi:MAG: acetate--CoA ligase family protein [Acidimicrobiaceae bacterium]|nr:acetate--CoA ligase family protein [Acidimicrobiaceae bacterium]MDE0514760.1 acetate--CoA ligase family protein [Acidimicrobiaceae bacterium]MDE0656715.1 acetate--CoA ligase family protein [Acidimicrobiaceae bacterium]MXZ97088.1 acetate--CoA ligase family protein [Acidimicrobiaceae bacterium]MYF43524.1 acetate--CoA ligase family protein [Acidimicrobiaceae bacterium]
MSRLDRLLRPRSLAFIGGTAAELAIDASRSFGFSGDMWAVNPRRELRDLPTFASVDELPAGADAAFVGVGCDATVEVVRQLAALGTGAAVCHASGFAETGEAGAALQAELLAAAAGMPIVGPNCYGTLSAPTGAALWPDVHGLSRTDRGVALLSQSGNIAVSLTMQRRGLDIAWVMTLGNQADLGISEAFEAAAADDGTTGVGLCIEELDDTERFVAAAASARRRGLPVVALKLGASETSGAIAVTHTASLVGDDSAYDALFDRLSIRRVHALPELLDTLAVLCALGPLHGSRLVSLSCSGGEAALVADRSRGLGLSFPPFAPDHADRVASALDGRVAVTNPLDYHTFIWGDEGRLTGCFKAALGADDPQSTPAPFDAALLVIDFPAEGLDRSRWWPTLDAFSEACSATSTPGVMAASLAENLPEEARARAAKLGLAACGDIDTALSALEAAAVWGEQTGNPVSLPDQPNEAGPGCTVMPEHESKQRLGAAGVAVPAGMVVTADRAAAAAAEVGYPVVVKATGSAHKTETGGVVVGLGDPAEVASAASRLAGDNGTVMVESCVTGAVAELLLSVRSAPPVGMLLTLGAGGILAEMLDDTANLLLPVSADEVRGALRRLRVWPMLAGHRGRPPAAVDAAVEAVSALGALVRDDRSIIEIEINPLIVTKEAAVAADALMLVGEVPEND